MRKNRGETEKKREKKDDNEWCLMMRLLRPRNSTQTLDRKLFNKTYLTFSTTTPKVTIENNNNNNKNYNNSESKPYWEQNNLLNNKNSKTIENNNNNNNGKTYFRNTTTVKLLRTILTKHCQEQLIRRRVWNITV